MYFLMFEWMLTLQKSETIFGISDMYIRKGLCKGHRTSR